MNLQQLRYFVALASIKHYGKTARELYITQPALSNAIRNLESELGYDLFDRTSEGVLLTNYGKLFHVHVSKALEEIDTAMSLVGPDETTVRRIRIGTVGTVENSYLRSLMLNFAEQGGFHTAFDIIEEATTFNCVESLKEDRLDVAFCGRIPSDDSFGWIPLMPFRMVVAVNKQHPLARRAAVSLAELKKYNIASYRGNSYLHWALKDIIEEYGIVCRQAFVNEHAGMTLIEADIRVAALTLDAFNEAERQEIAIVPIAELRKPFHMVGVIYDNNKEFPEEVRSFIEYLQEISDAKHIEAPLEDKYVENLWEKWSLEE